MSIKIKNIDPRPTDFDVKNLVINTKEGTIFYNRIYIYLDIKSN